MHELRTCAMKAFGKGITTDEQKYYYFDSDDDRIEVSDDEDLESAITTCKQPCLKIYIENYDVKKDPFFCSNNSSNKADQNTGASSERSKTMESRMSKLVPSTKSADDSIESIESSEDELPIPDAIKETVSCDSSFSEEEKVNEVGEGFTTPLQQPPISQRKNTEFDQNAFDLLDEKDCKISSRSIPRGYSIGNCKDPRFESTWAPSISKELQQHLDSDEFRKLKKEWQFQVKAEKCYDKEYDRRRYTGLDRMYCKLRVASGHPEERAKLANVEDNEPKMGNDDIILCKKGSLISKSWIVKNVGCTNWPKNPRIVVKNKTSGLVLPMVLDRLKPGDKMILTVNYSIPNDDQVDNDVHQILLNLNSKGFGDFGEKLALTYHVDDNLFDLKSQMDNGEMLVERVKLD